MPELPEVETVKRGLESLLDLPNEKILKAESSGKKLRYLSDLQDIAKLKDQHILSLKRRAKFLLFELNDYFLLSHLGMTGSWRLLKEEKKHDHIKIYLSGSRTLTYNDPRRFGMFEVYPKEALSSIAFFKNLGPDPTTDHSFDGQYLYQKSRGRKASIKALIMDQKIVVGVGNIYASEALFLAGIHPAKPAGKMSLKKCEVLVDAIREVLFDAIDCGGTTISDFKQAGGSEGYFQNLLLAYGRAGEECQFCNTPIRSRAIAQRNSFWCPQCQKL